MNGIALSRAFFEEYGRPMLAEQFPGLVPLVAVGLCGSGSECFGFDDEISRDHDFEPGFCVFLPEEAVVDRRTEFLLERAYAALPMEFRGLRRAALLPAGGARHGVLRTEEFFQRMAGAADGKLNTQQWLTIPEQALAEATNGELFFDNWGEVTRIRETLSAFPEDIRLKRLAGQLLLMGQAGQYNYPRCLAHGEPGAAQLALCEFVKSALSAAFLLNRRYQPYYKWTFRALRDLPKLSELEAPLERLLTTGNEAALAREKGALVEEIAAAVAGVLAEQGLGGSGGADLERHAYAVNDRIRDGEVRNLHILAAV